MAEFRRGLFSRENRDGVYLPSEQNAGIGVGDDFAEFWIYYDSDNEKAFFRNRNAGGTVTDIGRVGTRDTNPDFVWMTGNLETEGEGKGLIVKTPDGNNSYLISVDNSGNITSTLVS